MAAPMRLRADIVAVMSSGFEIGAQGKLWSYLETGLAPRFSTAILAATIAQLGFLSFTIGLGLKAIAQDRCEAGCMRYLGLDAVANKP